MSETRHRGAVLVVDRDPADARAVLSYLEERGYEAAWVDDGEKAYNRLDSEAIDALITDLNAPRIDGMRLMAVAKSRHFDILRQVLGMVEKVHHLVTVQEVA